MIETTADARRRGLYNPDYHINETNKHLFPATLDDNTRKGCKSRVGLSTNSGLAFRNRSKSIWHYTSHFGST
jgi:hypothetical protein